MKLTAEEYKEIKDSFNLLGKTAKQLKLTGMSESFSSDDEPEITGYLNGHPKRKKGYCYEVIIKEVYIHDEDQYIHEAGGLGVKPLLNGLPLKEMRSLLTDETIVVNEKNKPYREVKNPNRRVNNVEFTNKDKPIKI